MINVDKGCQYCNGEKADYQSTHNTKISIDTFGKARVLITECNACPTFVSCGMKDIPIRSAFEINHCPNCGRDLRKGDKND